MAVRSRPALGNSQSVSQWTLFYCPSSHSNYNVRGQTTPLVAWDTSHCQRISWPLTYHSFLSWGWGLHVVLTSHWCNVQILLIVMTRQGGRRRVLLLPPVWASSVFSKPDTRPHSRLSSSSDRLEPHQRVQFWSLIGPGEDLPSPLTRESTDKLTSFSGCQDHVSRGSSWPGI